REQLQSKEAKLRLEELQMVLIPVNYADANSVASQIRTLLSPRGVVSIDSRTNTLIVKDIPRYINQARNLIQALDTPTPQVIIEARIVEANTEFTRELGIAWGGRYVMDAAHGNPTGLVFPNSLGVQGIAGQSTSYPNLNYVVNMPAPVGLGSGGGIDIVLGSIDDTLALDLQLSAMETTGEGRVVSRPRVTTMDNQSATITQGVSIPYQTRTAGEAAMNFIEANLTLNVKPHVTADNNIVMELTVQRNAPNLSIPTATGNPAIDKKEATTNAMVRDGETIVIGGILVTEQTKSELAVPWLSRIPILGFFFRERKWVNSRKELLIFITPRILRERPQV
ncbi:MAG TPA: type IV pilus secretin PilQ, partial [Proteobacteria bacterium]|nr:type IV pilus secretin PilQ [Pseudomonadota bacterium]